MKRLIRYKNRKIYDSDIQAYVNVKEVVEMIFNDVSVQITEHATGEDCTSHILALALVEITKVADVSSGKILNIIKESFGTQSQIELQ